MKSRYERKEKEDFKSSVPCLILYVRVFEDINLDTKMRCFAKEYPKLSFDEFNKKIEFMCPNGEVLGSHNKNIENKFSKVDLTNISGNLGFVVCDDYRLNLKESGELFKELLWHFENC